MDTVNNKPSRARTKQKKNVNDSQVSDHQNFGNHLLYKFGVNFVSFMLIGFKVAPGNGFFATLLMFSTSLLFDSSRYSPSENYRKMLKSIYTAFLAVFFIFALLGLFGIFLIEKSDTELVVTMSRDMILYWNGKIPLRIIWMIVGFGPGVLALADVFSFQSEGEKNLLKRAVALKDS